ncbi:MAG: tRNA (adenosine(37)-N6)-threonylcarbamoyltransferase complex dimerization subunit type 1 TsaB [Desulfobulbus sp.]|nr:tRNA (adenosine(37)-N6)-threonylcarbamoyltransferase complex dimerization subunit type 1 TsaB [Desulfobulbus sp.]
MADVLILAIETSTGCGSVALTRGDGRFGKVLGEYTLQPEVTHSRRLLGSVSAMMQALSVSWNDLDGVAVSLGPGSFTGLRIGMAAAKGIAMAADRPLIGVPTFDALALQLTPTSLPVYLVLDARKQQVYAAPYHFSAEICQRSGPFVVLGAEQLRDTINEPTLVAGPGVIACADQLQEHPQVRLLRASVLHPRAAAIGFCGAAMLGQDDFVAVENLVPLYVRASEAELNLRRIEIRGM